MDKFITCFRQAIKFSKVHFTFFSTAPPTSLPSLSPPPPSLPSSLSAPYPYLSSIYPTFSLYMLTVKFFADSACFLLFFLLTQLGSVVSPFVEYLSVKVLPSLSKLTQQETRQELLQLLAEGCLYPIKEEVSSKCVEPVYTALLVSCVSMSAWTSICRCDLYLPHPLFVAGVHAPPPG